MNETSEISDGPSPMGQAGAPVAERAAGSGMPEASAYDDAKNAFYETNENDGQAEAPERAEQGADPVPESYELSVPLGMELDQAMLAEFTPVARDLGLSNDQAQALADAYARRMQAMVSGHLDDWNRQTDELAKAVMADREIGGGIQAFAEKRAVMKRALSGLGDRDFARAFEEGRPIHPNSPGLLRALYRLGQAGREDGFAEGGLSSGAPASGPQAWARSLYPTLTQSSTKE